MRQAAALAILLIPLIGPGGTTPAKKRAPISVYTVPQAGKLGLDPPWIWSKDQPASPLANRRVVVYGPAPSCDVTNVAFLHELTGGEPMTMHVVSFVLNRAPRPDFSSLAGLTLKGAKILPERTYQEAITRCKAAMSGRHFAEPVFAIEGPVRTATPTINRFGMTFHPPGFVVVAEDIRFVEVRSGVKDTERVLKEEAPAIVIGLAKMWAGQ